MDYTDLDLAIVNCCGLYMSQTSNKDITEDFIAPHIVVGLETTNTFKVNIFR